MAPLDSALALHSIPLSYFVIALLLVKSKPTTIPIKVYIAELRKLSKGGLRLEDNSNPSTYLDAIAYWRNAFNISQENNRSLRAQIAGLESSNECHLSSNAFQSCGQEQDNGPSRGKRKRNTSNPRPRSTRLAKQARLANISSPMQSRQIDPRNTNTARGSITPVPTTGITPNLPSNEFLHQVDVLQHLTSRSTPESKQIAAHLQKAFESISTLVPMVPKSGFQKQSIGQSHEGSNNVEIAAETSNAFPKMAARLLPVLLQAMDHMSQANQDQALEGSIVYKFVETYNTILHQVCSLAVHATLSCTAISAQSTLVSTRERQRAEGETNNPATISSTPHAEALLSLCDLAVAMTTALEPAKPAQARMLEGCLSHLITKIGSGLRTSIFGSSSNSNNDNNNNNSDAPSDPTQDLEGRLTAEADRQLEAQAPHLIYILARTPTHLPIISAHSSLPTQVETPSSVLLRLAKRKLQNTLLNAVFPAHALGLMKQTLKPPEEPPAAPLQSESSDGAVAEMEVEVREWYKSEVFRLVGWDALDEYLRVSVW